MLSLTRPDLGDRAKALDWVPPGLTLAASALLVTLGIVKPTPRFEQLSTIAIVFGFIGLSFAGLDVWRFLSPPADHGGHAPHRDLDHLLQAPLQRPKAGAAAPAA